MILAKKSLGQNFLKSEKALSQIVEAGEIAPGETVLEIGPGLGALTEKLLLSGARVIAVEKDDNLFTRLKGKFKNELEEGRIALIHEDIMGFKIETLREKYKLIANIPYNITGAILEKFLSASHQPEKMVLLVQKEVAERIVARDGKESILSISVKAYGKPTYIDRVLAGSFVPAPKVDSAIISIENISKDFFQDFTEKSFFRILKAGFSAKRKKLSSNLSTFAHKEKLEAALVTLGFTPNARAEELPPQGWRKITQIVQEL